jgi:hypothetical protein
MGKALRNFAKRSVRFLKRTGRRIARAVRGGSAPDPR